MAELITVPRVNNNDDEVTLVAWRVTPGQAVAAGDIVAEVETDKSVVEVESTHAGFVIATIGEPDTSIAVGSPMVWIGASADEAVPQTPTAGDTTQTTGQSPRNELPARLRLLLRRHGLQAADIPTRAGRLSIADVEAFIEARRTGQGPAEPGVLRDLSPEQKGMLATVNWHRDHAAAGYIETRYDQAAWEAHAEAFKDEHRLMMSPLLPLLAWRVAQLAAANPLLNATLVGNRRHEYSSVNLGFTVQAGATLYLVTVRDAAAMTPIEFVNALGEVMRRAMSHKLSARDVSGATIGFSSMARWKVSRHIPILAPHTSVMVAHTVDQDGTGVVGATYDHRVLDGGQVGALLNGLVKPARARTEESHA